MQTVFVVGDEPIEGYKLLESLGGSAFYRLWKVRALDGSLKLWKEIDLVVGNAAVETRTLGLLVQLKHENLNTLTNFWQLDEGRTLVIETEIPFSTIRERIEQGRKKGSPIPFDELIQYMEQAATGLDFLNSPIHDHEGQKVAIYHRALTPDSLLLFPSGSGYICKVSDFGLAKPVTEENAQHSQGLQHYDYDPPEFFDGKTAHTSDQYSLAINYYELRTAALPFPGTMLEQLQSKISESPQLDQIDDPERSIIRRALASDPDNRYKTCAEFVQQLKTGLPAAGPGTGAASRRSAPSPASSGSPAFPGASTPSSAGSSGPGFAAAAGLERTPSARPHPAKESPVAAQSPSSAASSPPDLPDGVVIHRPPPGLENRTPSTRPSGGPPAEAAVEALRRPRSAESVVERLRAPKSKDHGGRSSKGSDTHTTTRSGNNEDTVPVIWVVLVVLALAGLAAYLLLLP